MKRAFLSLVALLSLAAVSAIAAAPEAQVSAFLSLDRLPAGKQFQLAVVIDLKEPWHVNANPTTLPEFIPTTLTLNPPPSVVIERIIYPRGKTIKVSWAEQPVALYQGRAVIFAEGRVVSSAAPAPVAFEGALQYQACDDQVCLAPKTVPLSLKTEIVAADATAQAIHPEIFAAMPVSAAPPTAVGSSNYIASLIQQKGLAWTLAIVFVLGLGLNLTPCVYPMIAITVSYFGGGEGRTLARALAHATAYFLGIVVTYSALGLVAALTGALFGALLQSPVVLVGIALLLVVLALSMFGLFEIRPPQFMMQKATGLSSKAGYVGVFFLGASVGIIAAPCLAPIVVALLAFVGSTGNPWLGWWMFFVLACGLGLPYIVLGTFSNLLTRLPKSGTWMVWVKRVMGGALLVVAWWFVHPLFGWRGDAQSPIAWQPYAPESVASTAGKPVLVDLYADWCIPCKEMDKRTYADPRVIEKSKQFLMLKADLTKTGSPEVEKLQKDFHILGVPTTVFIGVDGRERSDLRQVGFVPADELLKLMDQALAPAPAASTNKTSSPMPEVPPQLLQPF